MRMREHGRSQGSLRERIGNLTLATHDAIDSTETGGDRLANTVDRHAGDAGWGVPARHAARWPALLAIVVAIALYVTLSSHLYYGPIWLIPAVEGALFLALLITRQIEGVAYRWERRAALGLVAAMNAANLGSLFLLIHRLLGSAQFQGHKISAQDLIIWSAQIWLTNVIVFGIWYWELDRGGPVARCLPHHRAPDLLFPQMANPDAASPGWVPSYFDYLYTSFTNATAFSPTDTMPMSAWAKALFMVQWLASVLTLVLVVARIANILPH